MTYSVEALYQIWNDDQGSRIEIKVEDDTIDFRYVDSEDNSSAIMLNNNQAGLLSATLDFLNTNRGWTETRKVWEGESGEMMEVGRVGPNMLEIRERDLTGKVFVAVNVDFEALPLIVDCLKKSLVQARVPELV